MKPTTISGETDRATASEAASASEAGRVTNHPKEHGRVRELANSRRRLLEARDDSLIAVVGMAGRFPGASNIEAFWRNLANGVESIRFFSREDYEAAGLSTKAFDSPNFVPARGQMDDVELFDAAFFGFSPREAELLDPQQRIFLECASEALERAGCDPDRFPGPIGVYAGQSYDRYIFNVMSKPEVVASAGGSFTFMGIGTGSDYLPMRVSYKLNLRGPSMNIQAGCSTSLLAVHAACQALVNYECDMALAGGVSVAHPRVGGYVFQDGALLSPDGHVRVFDANARGTVFSEGVGVVVLRRLTDAIAAGDRILAVVRGTASNNDGIEKASFTSPSTSAQVELISMTQTIAGVKPETIDYVELHGTATVVGDPIEAHALCQVFKGVGRRRCAVGSVKTNVGHLDQAAGIAGFIKTVLALEHRKIPPSLNFNEPNPAIDLKNGPLYVNTELTDWPSHGGSPRRAGVSAFGIGGTNVHVILEEAPAIPKSGNSRSWQLITLSAKTRRALDAATDRMAEYLDSVNPAVNLADVAYTLQVGRRQFEQRRAVVCRNAEEGAAALRSGDGARRWSAKADKDDAPAVVFMLPGQGTQYPNMGRNLYEDEQTFRQIVDGCCEQLHGHLGFDLRTVLFPASGREAEAAERLKRTSITQPALFIIEYALARLWMSWGVQPTAMIGHSIGELVAACLSGVLCLEDALRLVSIRGKVMEQAPPGVMLSLGVSEEQALRYVGDALWLAAVNAETACVMSGTETAVAELERRLHAEDVPSQRLETSHAFHCGLMDGAMESLKDAGRQLAPGRVGIPYVSNVTGDWVSADCPPDGAYWASHMREAVRFHRGIETLLSRFSRCVFLEVGPGHALSRLVKLNKACKREAPVISCLRGPRENTGDDEGVARALAHMWTAGVSIDWEAYSATQRRRKVELPTYPFDRKKYWVSMGKVEDSIFAGARARLAGLMKAENVGRWFYEPRWRPALLPRRSADQETPRRWLVLGSDESLGSQIITGLDARGAEVVRVRAAKKFQKIDDSCFEVSSSSPTDFSALVAALRERGWVPDVVVHGWGVTDGDTTPASSGYDRALLDRCFFSLLSLVQALANGMPEAEMRIEVLTDMAQQVSKQDAVCALKAVVIGLCRVIPQEIPTLTCRHVDIEYPSDESLLEVTASHVLSEMAWAPFAPSVAYRSRRRWLLEYQPAELKATSVEELPLRERGLYLITGGLGNLGLTTADALVNLCKARLILTSRSGLPDRSEWSNADAPWRKDLQIDARVRLVQDFERRGAEVLVAAVDATDANAMRQVVERAEQNWGPLCGVVHAAGVMGGSGFQGVLGLRADDCEQLFAPKIKGTLAIADLLENRPVDFCMLVSSLSVVLGGLGNGAYASANAYLDAFAASRYSSGNATRWVSVNWDQWNFVGEDVARGSALARFAMIPQEGVEALRRILATAELPHVVVSTADLDARLAQWVNRTAKSGTQEETSEPDAQLHERPELDDEFVAPRDETEAQIARIWTTLLAIDRVGIHDNFLDLGGHSLLAAQLLARLRKDFQVDVTLDEVFRNATVAEQAALVIERSAGEESDDLDMTLLSRLESMSAAERQALLEEARRARSEGR